MGSKDGHGNHKVFTWKNSNKLLKKGFNGVKTGNTPAAGPCLCTSYQREKLQVVVVVLDSKNMDN
jgi:D-alanyl-D-alanine carboxypeptidase